MWSSYLLNMMLLLSFQDDLPSKSIKGLREWEMLRLNLAVVWWSSRKLF